MCGIAGLVGPPGPEGEMLERMAERMTHRGPDSEGTWHDETAGLAIRRLAIIDLDRRSDQPLHFGPWHLVFNGEIYNYRELRDELLGLGHVFETEGDGEVLLHAWVEWEEAALDRLNGMFAVALWHDMRKELVCARDPFGEKPLFWAKGPAGFMFASEIRALLAVCPELRSPRDDAIAPFLGMALMPPVAESFFADIQQLPAAHLLRVHQRRIDVRRYWQPRRVEVASDYQTAAAELRDLLADSIRVRLRSDVAVGSSLSGGIDSSAIVCLASKIAGDHTRHAFTARFPGSERDEWEYAEVVGQEAGVTMHHAVEPTAGEFLDELEAVVSSQEEPFGSASIYAQWCVMRCAHEAGVTVLLDGQGADELFGGYAFSNGWALRSQGLAGAGRGLLSERDRADVLRALAAGRLPPSMTKFYWRRRVTPYASKTVRDAAAYIVVPAAPGEGFRSPISHELLRQTFHTSLPALLRYADRSSMAHSREVRLPFLDRRVAEYALSLPAGFLYRDGAKKAILREAVAGIAPPQVLARRDKIGFEPPQARWFSEPRFINLVSEALLDRQARTRGWYASDVIEADVAAGQWRDPAGIWRALNVELWLQAFQ
jgi:asparagine synthase (glutamine-hydrolysing)